MQHFATTKMMQGTPAILAHRTLPAIQTFATNKNVVRLASGVRRGTRQTFAPIRAYGNPLKINSKPDNGIESQQSYIRHILKGNSNSSSSNNSSSNCAPESTTLAHSSSPPFNGQASYSNGGTLGSETEAEVEDLRETISRLQRANAVLQQEMERVVGGLEELMDGVKHAHLETKSANKHLHKPPGAPTKVATPCVESVSCVVQHPGALCCTTTEINHFPGTVTIRMETTAKATEEAALSGTLKDEILTALGAQALVGAAADQVRTRSRTVRNQFALGKDSEHVHSELCRILGTGRIVHADRNPITSEFGHESFVAHLYDAATGRHLKAIFKPRVEGDADGWHRAPMEYVAYKLNLLLGLDYIPPVAYRSGGITLNIDGEDPLHYNEGAMMAWIDAATPLHEVPEKNWGVCKEELLSDTRILDVLLINSDRHHGHFLLGRHWCDDCMRPTLIDHAASFREGADVTMQHENAFKTGPVQCVRASTYLRLRFLDCPTLLAEFGGVLSESEIRGMARRRDAVLMYLDAMVKEHGFENVVKP